MYCEVNDKTASGEKLNLKGAFSVNVSLIGSAHKHKLVLFVMYCNKSFALLSWDWLDVLLPK